MKKNILLSLVAIILFTAKQGYAQKCETGKDPFTGEPAQIYKHKDNGLIFENKSGKVKLTIVNGYDGERNVIIPSGSNIQFKLDNDEIVNLKTINDAPPKSQLLGYAAVITYYSFTFDIDQETLKKLGDNLITLVRFPDANGGFEDRQIKGGRLAKYVKSLQKGANCMMGRDVGKESKKEEAE
jgi:hypothetical protein